MRIYLAGPDVFLPDARQVGARKVALAAAHGFEGAFPLDADLPADDWRAIAAGCEAAIRSCAAVVANLTPFRGPHADPGTAYEMGFARALGLPVFGYSAIAAPLRERIIGPRRREDGRWFDTEGMEVEDFGLADNLMMEGAIAASGGVMVRLDQADRWRGTEAFEACLAEMRIRLSPGGDGHARGGSRLDEGRS
jgi:nucleoside 2-deoxyribosyltransferase